MNVRVLRRCCVDTGQMCRCMRAVRHQGFRVVLCVAAACFRTLAVMRAWMQMVLDRYVSTQSIEETIIFVMDF